MKVQDIVNQILEFLILRLGRQARETFHDIIVQPDLGLLGLVAVSKSSRKRLF
jgi:hypothetical protein